MFTHLFRISCICPHSVPSSWDHASQILPSQCLDMGQSREQSLLMGTGHRLEPPGQNLFSTFCLSLSHSPCLRKRRECPKSLNDCRPLLEAIHRNHFNFTKGSQFFTLSMLLNVFLVSPTKTCFLRLVWELAKGRCCLRCGNRNSAQQFEGVAFPGTMPWSPLGSC